MGRIRSIKPEFFRHMLLYSLEKEHQLPLRVAFAGLITVADKEGRFRWHPEIIKLDVLPFDTVDMAKVMGIFLDNGFIKKYEYHGKEYGYFPTWHVHQRVRKDEMKSRLPPPPDINQTELVTSFKRTETEPTSWKGNMEGEGEGEGEGREVGQGLPIPKTVFIDSGFEEKKEDDLGLIEINPFPDPGETYLKNLESISDLGCFYLGNKQINSRPGAYLLQERREGLRTLHMNTFPHIRMDEGLAFFDSARPGGSWRDLSHLFNSYGHTLTEDYGRETNTESQSNAKAFGSHGTAKNGRNAQGFNSGVDQLSEQFFGTRVPHTGKSPGIHKDE